MARWQRQHSASALKGVLRDLARNSLVVKEIMLLGGMHRELSDHLWGMESQQVIPYLVTTGAEWIVEHFVPASQHPSLLEAVGLAGGLGPSA
jgi:hypothetical protein